MSQCAMYLACFLLFASPGGWAMQDPSRPPSQPPPPAASHVPVGRVVSGVVLSAKTGQPIFEAEVTLSRTKDRVLTASTVTDGEGRFTFSNVPDGKFALHASHRGYIGAEYDEHANGSTAIVTGEGQNTSGLEFRLAPQGVFYGVVSEDSGDPVPQAQIALYRQDISGGSGRTIRAAMTGADDQGNYEIANLAPGTYFLSVTGTPWYATQPASQSQSPPGRGSASAPRSPLDVAYPTTFYPDATDSAYAAPIAVSAGDRVQINLTLHPVPSLHIVLHVPNRQPSVPQLRQDIFGSANPIQSRMSFSNSDGNGGVTTIEFSGIAPGIYDLELLGQNGETSRETTVNLTSDQALDINSTTTLADVSGKISLAAPGKFPASTVISLSPQDGQAEENRAFTRLESDGSFRFRSVRPGAYELVVSGDEYPLNVTQLSATGAAVSGRIIRVGNDPVTLTATVAESTAVVHGFAQSNGQPASGVFLLLVPDSPNAGREAWRANQSDSDGSFDFPQVMPGQYTLVAIREGWTLDWARPEIIVRYQPGGLKINVPAHAGDVNLKSAVEVQPK